MELSKQDTNLRTFVADDVCEQAELLELARRQQIFELRPQKFPVFNGQGFIRLVDVLGTDDSIIEAARTTSQIEGSTFQDDRMLLRYLMRHRHSTPFEFCDLVLHVKVPMDCWRQWIRHRTASVNEYSTRYSPAIDERALTPPDKWREQSASNRQGSASGFVDEWPAGYTFDRVDDTDVVRRPDGTILRYNVPPGTTFGQFLTMQESNLHEFSDQVYNLRLEGNVAKEQARKDLPLSTFTESRWKINLHNLLHFLSLRMDAHAQLEIRECATVIGEELVARLWPVTWEAFLDYRFNALTLTALDIEVCKNITDTARMGEMHAAADPNSVGFSPPYPAKLFMQCQPAAWQPLKRCRERQECWKKLEQIGLVALDEGEEPVA